jgi:hypothetical protein
MGEAMRKILCFCVAVLLTGCTQRPADPDKHVARPVSRESEYDKAMKRVVAEQKQLDWIEAKIKATEKEAKEKDEELFKEYMAVLDVIGLPGSTRTSEQNQKEMKEASKKKGEAQDRYAQELKIWNEKKAEQMKRLEAARKAADTSAGAN